MSATGRKSARLGGPADDYPTPAWCVRRLLEVVTLLDGVWLEPTAGDGAIIRAVGLAVPRWYAVELQVKHETRLAETLRMHGSTPIIGDFLRCTPKDFPLVPSCVITNPPYGIAMAVIEHALRLFPSAAVAMLLRVNFLASAERQPWLVKHPPDVYVLPDRPQFRRNANGKRGTDSTEYGWFVWPPGTPPRYRPYGRLSVLATTPLAERQVEMPL